MTPTCVKQCFKQPLNSIYTGFVGLCTTANSIAFVIYFFPQKHCNCTDVSRAVYYVSITQGQTQSSSFRTCAVSAFTAHRFIPLMQSKHVINGPSQPPLFVVRQTFKSNVSTMEGGKKSARTAKVLMLGVSATQRFLLFCIFFYFY